MRSKYVILGLILIVASVCVTLEVLWSNTEEIQSLWNPVSHLDKITDSMISNINMDKKSLHSDGCIIYLAPTKNATMGVDGQVFSRKKLLQVSMKRLQKFYLNKFPAPICIFHEDFTQKDFKTFRNKVSVPVHFVQINFADTVPTCAHNVTGKDEYGTSIGYRQMCRFWSGIVQNSHYLRHYKYYMRLDDDSMFMSAASRDYFKVMATGSFKYVFKDIFSDKKHSEQLWKYTSQWMNDTLFNTTLSGYWKSQTELTYKGKAPYNNFHMSDLEIWRSDQFHNYFEYMDNTCGFFTLGWGDANFHAMVMELFLKQVEIYRYQTVPYQHNNNFAVKGGNTWTSDP